MIRSLIALALLAGCGKAASKPDNHPPQFAGVTDVRQVGDELVVRWDAATDDSTAPDAIRYRVVVVPRYGQRLLAAGWVPSEPMAHVDEHFTAVGVTEQRLPMPTGPGWVGACCAVRVRAIDAANAADANVATRALPDPARATRNPAECTAALSSLAQLRTEGGAALAAQLDEGVADAGLNVVEMLDMRESIDAYQAARRAVRTRSEQLDTGRTALRAALDDLPQWQNHAVDTATGVAFMRGATAVWSPEHPDLLFAEATGVQVALPRPDAELDALVTVYNAAADPVGERSNAWSHVDLLASWGRHLAKPKHPYQYFLTVQDYFARTSAVAKQALDACDDPVQRSELRAGAHFGFIDASLAELAARLDASIRNR